MDAANLLREYARALDRATHPIRLVELECRFLALHNLEEVPDTWLPIRAAHRARVNGDGSPADCDQALNEAIRSLT